MSPPKIACSADTADLFFSDNPFEQQRALRLCARCAALVACRQLGKNERFGIWGGTTASDRGFQRTRSHATPSSVATSA